MLPTHRTLKATITATLASAGLLAAPSAAGALTVTLTEAGGSPQRLVQGQSLTVSDPSPTITATPGTNEGYTLSVIDQAGDPAMESFYCRFVPRSAPIQYHGTGTYTIKFKVVDTNCQATGSETTMQVRISPITTIAAAAPVLLARHAGSSNAIAHRFGLVFPSKSAPEVAYADGNVTAAPNGSIPGMKGPFKGTANPDGRTGWVNLAFPAPGVYSVFSRARIAGTSQPTPWSAPIAVRVIRPFEVDKVRFLDRTGPSYRVAGYFDNKAIAGRIVIDVARGSKQTKNPKKSREYRRLGTVTIKNGRFTKRFRTHRRGLHRIRFSFGGTPNAVAAGNAVTKVRFGSRAR